MAPIITPKCTYEGDGNCDAANNNKNCHFDGGDCCEPTKFGPVKMTYCDKTKHPELCKCLDPNHKGPAEPKKPNGKKGPKGKKSPKGHDHEPKSPKGKSPKGPPQPKKPNGKGEN